jgi:hypothetical protein
MPRRSFNTLLWLVAVALFLAVQTKAIQGLAVAGLMLWSVMEYQSLALRSKEVAQ